MGSMERKGFPQKPGIIGITTRATGHHLRVRIRILHANKDCTKAAMIPWKSLRYFSLK